MKQDSVFIKGTFSNWDTFPDPAYKLKSGKNHTWSIELRLPAGTHRYKYTGGRWTSVEKDFGGVEIADHIIQVRGDTIVHDTVRHWRNYLVPNYRHLLQNSSTDTSRVMMALSLASFYTFNADYLNDDSAAYYLALAHELFQKIESSTAVKLWSFYHEWRIYMREITATLWDAKSNFAQSLEIRLENLKFGEEKSDLNQLAYIHQGILLTYFRMKDYANAMIYMRKLQDIIIKAGPAQLNMGYYQPAVDYYFALAYYKVNKLDSALYYVRKSYHMAAQHEFLLLQCRQLFGDIYLEINEPDSAFHYYNISRQFGEHENMQHINAMSMTGLAKLYHQRGNLDSAIYFASNAIQTLDQYRVFIQARGENADAFIADVAPFIAELYKSNHRMDSAYKYLQLSIHLRDSLYDSDKIRQIQNLTFNEQLRKQRLAKEIEDAHLANQAKLKQYGLIFGMITFLMIAFILFRNNRIKQQANISLSQQKIVLEKTLDDLQVTQKQLIQSEKMASLGELTAGIAHEIQNPLNFVNNFSEVNSELIAEMKQEVAAGNFEEVKNIANAIDENEQKIIFHGKRADAIVKGMLQHSRSSSGVKELTDINALTDEYLRLAYHGLRAKDKSFNATLTTDFDKDLGLIKVVPQDIGRVILNLITNAFYAVSEKNKQQPENYQPTVEVRTKRIGDKIEIRVRDNGNGIPQHVIDKIFQPFFTTKPTGQGTGLGLSLSYDIVKTHGGELKVETKEGEETEFIILLPVGPEKP